MNVWKLFLVSILALVSSVAVAGQVQPAEVDVDLDNFTASGDMLSARHAKGKDVFIGCGVRTWDFGEEPFYFGFCQAEDAEGDHIVCVTEDPDLLFAMNAAADYSFVTFSWTEEAPEQYQCIRIGFSNQSFYLPKTVK